jgi:extracellular elastinolytic metalloproteinase
MKRAPLGALAACAVALVALALPGASLGVAEIQGEEPQILDGQQLRDYDSRTAIVSPSAAQEAAAARLDATVRWNDFGTPQSVGRHGDYLASGIGAGSASAAAGEWLSANRALFGLGSLSSLKLDHAARLPSSNAYAVIYRQEFGALEGADNVVTVGVSGSAASGWKVGYVSSTLARDTGIVGEATMSAEQAWLKAAGNIGRGPGSIAAIDPAGMQGDWTLLDVAGLQRDQKVRPVGFATHTAGAIPAYETLFMSNGGETMFKHVVDGRTGRVLLRQNLVHNLAGEQNAIVPQPPFSGEVPAADGACGPRHGPYTVSTPITAISGVATATLSSNDIVFNLYRGTTHLRSADTGTSPESLTYAPTGGVAPGDYFFEVCDFVDNNVWASPRTYTGTVNFDDAAPLPYPPRWKVFPATPLHFTLPADPWNVPETDIRKAWCWDAVLNGEPVAGCEAEVKNLASRGPWDQDMRLNVPTFTTIGNNANSHERWLATAPVGTLFRPTNPTRDYTFPWTNEWETRDCPDLGTRTAPLITPGVSLDISAAVTNLFVAHNRMHDWAYHLGLTEENWNAQSFNFGLTNPQGENDPVDGRAQSGAIAPGSRNNANMGTPPDGSSPVTNMFLWQPQSAAFYAPCVDGDFDMQIIGHEYGHMIENRLIGKGAGRQQHHAGAMGESHGDLFGMEYVNEFNFVPVTDENRYSVGAYATGNKQRAIRNYGMNFPYTGDVPEPSDNGGVNPLNFSAMGYDLTGPQVHADGEIWSATNFEIRQALNAKYDGAFPSSNATLQTRCANGEIPPDLCPGNRRWMQLVFDAMLLMPIAPSMLDARDAQLAADLMRFGGANQSELWHAFAHRGFGAGASSSNTTADTDTDPTPDFRSPIHPFATVKFQVTSRDGGDNPIPARIYVGHYEAGVSPIADTNPATSGQNLDDTAEFVAGEYELVANAPGYGHVRFQADLRANSSPTIRIRMPTNYASKSQGAVASGDVNLQHACFGPPTIPAPECTSETPADLQASLDSLVDDTESTMWENFETVVAPPGGNGPVVVDGTKVTVDLAGTAPVSVDRVQVSAMLKPFIRPLPVAGANVLFNPNRFTALRSFEIAACNTQSGANCSTDAGFFTVYTAPADAFPSAPPRPVAPEMIIRSFDIPATRATHLRLIVKHSQCTGERAFQGDQDSAAANPDCDAVAQRGDRATFVSGSSKAGVRAAELQAFSSDPVVTGPGTNPQPQPQPQPQPNPKPHAKRCVVPRLKGMPLRRARSVIRNRHCRVGKVIRRKSHARKQLVIGQRPAARTRLRVGARVNLVVSTGSRPARKASSRSRR